MKLLYPILLLTFLQSLLFSQTPITGTVTDANTNEAVVGASVYVANTSYGTFTEIDGSFELRDYPSESFYLNISSIGYKTELVEISKESISQKLLIQLQPKTEEIDAVTVIGEREDLWPEFGPFFRELFIGYSKQAEDCKILNREDIFFNYDPQTNQLKVTARKPIAIRNKALGYEIEFWLEQFEYNYKTGYLIYQGYPFYKDLYAGKKNKKIQKQRKQAYQGSLMHFLRAAYMGNHKQEDFVVHKLQRRAISELYPDSAKRIDTLNADQMREELGNIITNDYESSNLLQAVDWWNQNATDSLFTQKMRMMENGRLKTERFEFLRPSHLTNKIILTRYEPSYLIEKKGQNGLYDVLTESDISTDFFAKTANGKRVLAFNDFLLIVYLNEIEEREYQLKDMFSSDYKKVNQSSVLSILSNQNLEILKEGIVTDPSILFIEQYWTFEKMDKMLPLNYQPPLD